MYGGAFGRLGRLRQENCKDFKANLGYIERPYIKHAYTVMGRAGGIWIIIYEWMNEWMPGYPNQESPILYLRSCPYPNELHFIYSLGCWAFLLCFCIFIKGQIQHKGSISVSNSGQSILARDNLVGNPVKGTLASKFFWIYTAVRLSKHEMSSEKHKLARPNEWGNSNNNFYHLLNTSYMPGPMLQILLAWIISSDLKGWYSFYRWEYAGTKILRNSFNFPKVQMWTQPSSLKAYASVYYTMHSSSRTEDRMDRREA